MMNVEIKSSKQSAIFKIDHRLVECDFYRVQAAKPGSHRVVLIVKRDAGNNPDNSDRALQVLGISIRKDFNRQGWCYLSDGNFFQLICR